MLLYEYILQEACQLLISAYVSMGYVYFVVSGLILVGFYFRGVTVDPAKCYGWSVVGNSSVWVLSVCTVVALSIAISFTC